MALCHPTYREQQNRNMLHMRWAHLAAHLGSESLAALKTLPTSGGAGGDETGLLGRSYG